MSICRQLHTRPGILLALAFVVAGFGCSDPGPDPGQTNNIVPLHRPFAVNPFNHQQRILGIFESELGLNQVGVYVRNEGQVAETNVIVRLVAPASSTIQVTTPEASIASLEPGVSTLIFLEADFGGVAPDKYDLTVTTSSDQSPAQHRPARIFTATTTFTASDPDFDGRPTFATSFREGTLTVDLESFYGGPNWRSSFAPTRETMSLVYAQPFEGQMGPVPFQDWFWKAAGAVGKGLVAFSAGYYLSEGIEEDDVAKPAGAGGTFLMTIAEVATFSDDEDPIFRGQQATQPGPGERTVKETVTLDATYPTEPLSGAPFTATTSWVYTRYTEDAAGTVRTYEHRIANETVQNQHPGGPHTLATDHSSYQRGETATITVSADSVSGAPLLGDAAYVSITLAASSRDSQGVVLTDDGQGADATAGDGTYTAAVALDPGWPAGSWSIAVFVQENLFGFNEYGGLVLNTFGEGGPAAVWERQIDVQ